MKRYINLVIAAAALAVATPAHAQLSKVLREGAEIVGKKAIGKAGREGAQEGTELAVRKGTQVLAREAAQESAEVIARQAGLPLSDEVVRAVGKHGPSITAPLVEQFGDDVAQALAKLSSGNARRMAIMADDFASTAQGTDFMRVLADKGDVAAEWLWKNKGAIAVSTGAAAFLANPDAFLNAGESVVATAIETAGADVARPLIQETASHVGPAIAKPVGAFTYVVLGGLPLAACAAWCLYVRPWLRRARAISAE